jgi:hypothetical protein
MPYNYFLIKENTWQVNVHVVLQSSSVDELIAPTNQNLKP